MHKVNVSIPNKVPYQQGHTHRENLKLSWIKQIRCSRSADKLQRLLLATKPAVENSVDFDFYLASRIFFG